MPGQTGQIRPNGAALQPESSRSAGLVVFLIAIAIAVIGEIVVFAVIGSGAGKTTPSGAAGSPGASVPIGTVVFSDDFHDRTTGWSTDTLPSGTTYKYTANGFEVHAVGALHHITAAPSVRPRQRISVLMVATESAPAPDAAGFGVTCDRGKDAAEIRYEFIAFADGSWTIERLYGPLSSTTSTPDILKTGKLASKPGALPMTVEGSCLSAAGGGLTTQLSFSVDGVKLADVSDTSRALPDTGWYAELLVASDDPPTTVTVTKYEVRIIP